MQVLDAKILKLVDKAELGLKVPFPVHSTWFADDATWFAEDPSDSERSHLDPLFCVRLLDLAVLAIFRSVRPSQAF